MTVYILFVFREQKLDKHYVYTRDVSLKDNLIDIKQNVYALKSNSEWFVVSSRNFIDSSYENGSVWVCTCKDAGEARERLVALDMVTDMDVAQFVSEEESQYCCHCRAVSDLRGSPDSSSSASEGESTERVHQLSHKPLVYAVYAHDRYGFVCRGRSNFNCKTCKKKRLSTFGRIRSLVPSE